MTDRLYGLVLVSLLALSGHLHARCGAEALALSGAQGSGPVSPLVGQTVTVEGIITMDSRHPRGWRGFYLQQADTDTDNNPRSSEALFVYTDRSGGGIGSVARVTGRIKEYHGLTELVQVSALTICGSGPLPAAIPVQLPWPDQAPPEHLENMRINLTRPLTLIGHHGFARYGELILADQPQLAPTERLPPGPEALHLAQQQALNRLYLDDGRSVRNPDPLPWPAAKLAAGESVRAGDQVSELTGILDFRFGHWRLQPSRRPDIIQRYPRPPAPRKTVATTLRVVTLNLGNFFNGADGGKDFATSRGARSKDQLAAQTSRLVATLKALDADVIAAIEMENDDYSDTSAVADLAAALGANWRFVATPGATGSDAIRTDLLYRGDRVRALGPPRRLIGGAFRHRGRPPLAQVFQPLSGSTPASVRILVPHFKSKACDGARGADQAQHDGQGCYARRRTEAAEALVDWLGALPDPQTASGSFAGTLITGDLNSYAREWPIQRLERAGLTNLIRARQPCNAASCRQTSYRFQGRAGSLDYAMGSESLLGHVVGAGVWSVNAAEFPAIGYRGPILAPADAPWRSSDHDPVYTDLAL